MYPRNITLCSGHKQMESTLALSFASPHLQPIHPVWIDSIIIERFGPKLVAVGGDAVLARTAIAFPQDQSFLADASSRSRVCFAHQPCRSHAGVTEGAGGEASSWSMATSSV